MINTLNPIDYPIAPIDLTRLFSQIGAGRVVLFLGSGFSRNATSITGDKFKTAIELANMIGDLGGFDSMGDLRYASENFIRENDSKRLVSFLRDMFSVKEVEEYHQNIASASWLRVYTTNYDLLFERAAEKVGKRVRTLETSDPLNLNDGDLCIHLNGSINNLTTESLNTSFKLSESSYLSPDSFVNSDWGYRFKKDLEFSSAVVFIGYSLYDIEVRKILYENNSLSDKTYFIKGKNVTKRDRFTLQPYGNIVPIEAEEFGRQLASYLKEMVIEEDLNLSSIVEYKIDELDQEANDSDVHNFLMFGRVSDSLISSSLLSPAGAPILIRRTELEVAEKLLDTNSPLVVIADFGNGKTIFLKSLQTYLSHKGAAVYVVENDDEYNYEDLELIAKSESICYLFIDRYEQHMDLLRHYRDIGETNLRLVLAARTASHNRLKGEVSDLGFFFNELSLDELDDEEIFDFIEILSSSGLLGEYASRSERQRHKLISIDNRRQLSMSLLSIIEAPQVIDKVKILLGDVLSKKKYKDTLFSIAILSFLNMPLSSSLISEFAFNDEIYSSSFLDNSGFKQVFRVDGTKIRNESSLFSLALFRHIFQSPYIVDQLLKIVEMLADKSSDSQKNSIFTELLRFSVVERIFPEKQRINNLVSYYEKIKRQVYWLKDDPHYWLQYAMTQLAYDDFIKAQKYLDQAYALAQRRDAYHTQHIDTQQSRLYLKDAAREKRPAESFRKFMDAINLMKKLPSSIYKFRTADNIKSVYEYSYVNYTPHQQTQFYQASVELLEEVGCYLDSISANSRSPRVEKQFQVSVQRIVDSIKSKKI